jgi:hypothetical protein
LLSFTVNGKGPGEALDLSGTDSTVHVRAEASSLVPFERLEVVANNVVVADRSATGSPLTAVLEADVPMPLGGWLTARCWGPYLDRLNGWVGAQSSAVYVQVAGRGPPIDPASLIALDRHFEKPLWWVDCEARFENDAQRERLAAIFRSARDHLGKRTR